MAVIQQRDTRQPLRAGVRQSRQNVSREQIQIGSQVSTLFPSVGYLSNIVVNVHAVVTLSAPGVLTTNAPWDLTKHFKLNLNNGTTIYDASGFGTLVVNQRGLMRSYDPLNPAIFQCPTNTGVNHWYYSLIIPVAMNSRLQFGLGLILLQAQEISARLETIFASNLADVVSNCTSITGDVDISYEYYEVPDHRYFKEPEPVTHRIIEDIQPITNTGDFRYVVPREGSLLQLMHVVRLNGLNATSGQGNFPGQVNQVDNMRLQINNTQTVYNLPMRAQAVYQLLDNGVYSGVFEYNFLDGGVTGTGEGDSRDWFDAGSIAKLESILTINSGATLGTVADVRTIRRIMQTLQR